jgi:4-coumarate--CoA ligase
MTWWTERAALRRFIGDLVAAELARLRPGHPLPPAGARPDGLEIWPGVGSPERAALAAALSEALHLRGSGIEGVLLARPTLSDWIDLSAGALARSGAAITFRTSGSTGAPKPCTHDLERLEEEVATLAAILGPAPGPAERPIRRVVACVPAHHIYGFLFTILLPRAFGASVEDGRGRPPGRLAAALGPGDLVVAVPDTWAAVARLDAPIRGGVVGTCSTAPLDRAVARRLRAQGLGRLVEVYGASETAGIGWRDDPDAPYTLFPYWRLEPAGPAVVDDRLGRRAALPDLVEPAGPRHIRVIGRRDGAVQVGGTNVFPGRIEAVLATHPDVRAAAVRPFTVDGTTRLEAVIVPAAGCDTGRLRTALEAWATARLTPPERPRAWTFGAAIPRGPAAGTAP